MSKGSPDTAMIITGRKRGGPRQLGDYLMDEGENEIVRVCEIGCFVAKTVPEALAEMWSIADGCKAKDFLYHASINPRPGVTLSDKQWKEAVDTLEKNLGLVGHQRVVVEHVKKGRTHRHVAWNRVDPKTGRVKKLSFDRRTLRATALELGNKFGLVPTLNKGQSFKRGDIERGKRTGIDPKIVKAEVTALWNKSKSGKEFVACLAKHGYILAKGDKGQFVIIDRAGSIHGLTRRISGATAKTVKRGLADIDITTLPTIAEAKSRIKARLPKYTADKSSKPHNRAHTYIRRSRGVKKGGAAYARRNRIFTSRWQDKPPTKSWRPYGSFLTRHAGIALKPLTPINPLKKNGLTTGITTSHKLIASAFTGKIPATGANGKNMVRVQAQTTAQGQNNAPYENKNTKNVTGGTASNFGTGGTIPQPHAHTPSTSGGFALPLAIFPFRGIGWMNLSKAARYSAEERQQPSAPSRPASGKQMSAAQEADLNAVYLGLMSWAEYCRKWGIGGDLSL